MCRVFWLVLIFVFAGLILHVLYCFGLIISFYFLQFQGLTDRRCIAFCEFSFYSRRNQVHWFCLLNLWTILCLQIWWQFTLILLSHNPFITDTHQRGQIFFETKKKNLKKSIRRDFFTVEISFDNVSNLLEFSVYFPQSILKEWIVIIMVLIS